MLSADAIVPGLGVGQRDYWSPDTRTPLDSAGKWFMYFQTVADVELALAHRAFDQCAIQHPAHQMRAIGGAQTIGAVDLAILRHVDRIHAPSVVEPKRVLGGDILDPSGFDPDHPAPIPASAWATPGPKGRRAQLQTYCSNRCLDAVWHQSLVSGDIMKHWVLLLIAGIVAVAGGVIALFNPLAATLTATTLVAWLFLFMGALQIVAAFGDMGTGARIWTLLLGALAIFIGAWILSNPIAGTLALTQTIGLLFFIEGAVKLVLAFAARGTPYFWALLLSGVISILLGGMILSRIPESALAIPGILLAVDLISTGVSMVALALHFKGRSATA